MRKNKHIHEVPAKWWSNGLVDSQPKKFFCGEQNYKPLSPEREFISLSAVLVSRSQILHVH